MLNVISDTELTEILQLFGRRVSESLSDVNQAHISPVITLRYEYNAHYELSCWTLSARQKQKIFLL